MRRLPFSPGTSRPRPAAHRRPGRSMSIPRSPPPTSTFAPPPPGIRALSKRPLSFQLSTHAFLAALGRIPHRGGISSRRPHTEIGLDRGIGGQYSSSSLPGWPAAVPTHEILSGVPRSDPSEPIRPINQGFAGSPRSPCPWASRTGTCLRYGRPRAPPGRASLSSRRYSGLSLPYIPRPGSARL
jgi:hypothetical protein